MIHHRWFATSIAVDRTTNPHSTKTNHHTILALALAATLSACAGATTQSAATPASSPAPAAAASTSAAAIDAAVAHPARYDEDRARDPDRKPADVLRFFGIAPGSNVAEMMAGRGYYAELLARVVGPTGVVYAQNNRFVLEKFAAAPLAERLGRAGLGHVRRLDRELEDPGLPVGELDAVLMVLFYHDTYWMGVDRPRMLAAIFASLRPGGVFGVVDHVAADGSGDRDVKTLHRIDRAWVLREVLAAGFVLQAESDVLHHAGDDRSKNVFDPSLRGRTDRFVLRFRKP